MSGADTRGFSYVLEPVHRQREWKFHAALARVGKLYRQLDDKVAARHAIHKECAAQAAQVSRAWAARPDPLAQARVLRYLAALHKRRADAEREVATLAETLRQARQECAVQQQALEEFDRHRAGLLRAYAGDQLRKLSAHADQDWSARNSHKPFKGDAR
jgi:hypothetical protein